MSGLLTLGYFDGICHGLVEVPRRMSLKTGANRGVALARLGTIASRDCNRLLSCRSLELKRQTRIESKGGMLAWIYLPEAVTMELLAFTTSLTVQRQATHWHRRSDSKLSSSVKPSPVDDPLSPNHPARLPYDLKAV